MDIKKVLAIVVLSFLSAVGYASTFSVQYKPVATQPSNHKIEAEVRITNTSSQSVNLASTSIQYYFTKEGASALVGKSDYAAVLGASYRDVTSSVAVVADTSKINITFASTAGVLLAGQTIHVQFRVNAIDWFMQNQTNDPSFNGSITTFTTVTNITVNGGTSNLVALSGSIKNTTGGYIAGAKIKFPGGEATSAVDGRFSATANISGPVAITVSAPGYADLSKVYTPKSGKIGLFANLLKHDKTQVITTNVANTVTTSGGASVTFPPMFDITEPVAVSLTHIRANTRDILSASGDFSALTSNGSQVQLSSQGMLDVVIKGVQTGQIYSLANKGPFTIKIPASIPSTAPATIPMWYYNPASGKWMEEGSATLSNGVYTGSVTHFTTWNMDIPACGGANGVCGCITGTVVDPSNVNFANANHLYTIQAEGSGWSKTIEATGAQISPNFGLNLLPAGPATVTIINRSTHWRGSLGRDVTAGPSCTAFSGIELARASIVGTITNACTQAPFPNAKVEVLDAFEVPISMTFTDSMGAYSFPAIALESDVEYNLRISSPSFKEITVGGVTVTDNKALVIDRVLSVVDNGVTGILKGRVINAVDGLPLVGASFEITEGINTTGPIIRTGTTDANGQYSLGLPQGSYTIRAFNATGSGTATGESTACGKNAPNIVIGPTIAGMRIIMSWNQGTPSDLDSYLRGPGFRTHYLNKTVAGIATLNIDANGANSVEVTTLLQETKDAVYTFSVHDYSNRASTTSRALLQSGVTVTVVRNGVVTNTFNIPSTGATAGTLWRVFKMVNGVITPLNEIVNESNTANI